MEDNPNGKQGNGWIAILKNHHANSCRLVDGLAQSSCSSSMASLLIFDEIDVDATDAENAVDAIWTVCPSSTCMGNAVGWYLVLFA